MKRRKITDVGQIDFATIQQGDVLFHAVDKLPSGLKSKGDNVVEEGEHTGHAHRLDENIDFDLTLDNNGNKFLKTSPLHLVPIRHEEHKEIPLPKDKKFRVGKVREFNPVDETLRPVVD